MSRRFELLSLAPTVGSASRAKAADFAVLLAATEVATRLQALTQVSDFALLLSSDATNGRAADVWEFHAVGVAASVTILDE
jgi:hypothetical protein